MQEFDLHIAETRPWRALINEAQLVARVQLPPVLEDYVMCMLLRQVGTPFGAGDTCPAGLLDKLVDEMGRRGEDPRLTGDRCLTYCGLFPEHAISEGVPIMYLVRLGRDAYLRYAATSESKIYAYLGEAFVPVMDVLQTMSELSDGEPCLDPLNAYQLWHDAGSTHAWRVLRSLTPSLPGAETNSALH